MNSQAIAGCAKIPAYRPCLEVIPMAFVGAIQSLGVIVTGFSFDFSINPLYAS